MLQLNENAFYRDVGAAIAKARRENKLSQEALSKLVGMTRVSITNIEAGRQKTPLTTLYRLAFALGVAATDLLPQEFKQVVEVKPEPSKLHQRLLSENDATLKSWVMEARKKTGSHG